MRPTCLAGKSSGQWALKNQRNDWIIYSTEPTIALDLSSAPKNFLVRWIDTNSGKLIKEEKIEGGKNATLQCPVKSDVIAWIIAL